MNERDLWWKIVMIGGFVALAVASVWPIEEKMKFGIDLHGGYSLLYEIDDTGVEGGARQELSERVMRVLRERVDPKGVYNLVWRPIGHNRLEIQMPRPSEEVRQNRAAFERLQEKIRNTLVRRSDVLRVLSLPKSERPAAFAELAEGVPGRMRLLEEAADAYDAYKAAEAEYEARKQRIESDNLSREDVLAAVQAPADERAARFEALIRGIPQRAELLEAAAVKYDAWQAVVPAEEQSMTPEQTVEIARLKRAFEQSVQAVLDANVDPNDPAQGVTIDRVLEMEIALDQAIARAEATNIDVGKLRSALEQPQGNPDREDKLAEIKQNFPELAETIDAMVEAMNALQVKRKGEGRLEDPADLQRLLRGAGVLEFRILPKQSDEQVGFEEYRRQLRERGPRRAPGEDRYQWFEVEDPKDFFRTEDYASNFEQIKQTSELVVERFGDKYYVLAEIVPDSVLVHRPDEQDWSLKNAYPTRDQNGRPAIGFELDARGGAKFARLTAKHKNRQLAIFIDDQVVSSANINDVIGTSGIIMGNFKTQYVNDMVKKLDAGSLPKKLKDPPISVRSIGPALGEANRTAGLNAAKWGAILVAIFMVVYYFYAGGIAVIAVGMNILLIGAMMATLGATLTLPGIAGLVLAIGMAVDANVLINERIREELKRGTAMRMAVKLGYERAFRAIFDSNTTTVLTCIILYVLGSEEVKGFGLTLGIGVFINIFTAYFVTRVFFEFMSLVSIPGEVRRYPVLTAAIVLAFGALVYGIGYWTNPAELRDQSVMILFGKSIMFAAPAIIAIQILMSIARSIHTAYQKGDRPRVPMFDFVGVPKISWINKRPVFVVVSLILVLSLGGMYFNTPAKNLYDIEFLGGTAAQIDLKEPGSLDQTEIMDRLGESGEQLKQLGEAMAQATVSSTTSGTFVLETPGVPAARLEPIVLSVLDKKLSQVAPVTFEDPAAEQITIRTKAEAKTDVAAMKDAVVTFAQRFKEAGEAIAGAQVQRVQAVGAETEPDNSFEIVTREPSKEVVIAAIMDTLGEDINVQPALTFKMADNPDMGGAPYFPIRTNDAADLGVALSDRELLNVNLTGWQGGVALVLEDITPPQKVAVLQERLRAMRLQPGFEKYGWREAQVFGLTPASGDSDAYKRVLVTVIDENYPLEDLSGGISQTWISELAVPEVELLQAALQRQTSLSQITQFDHQVSDDAKRDAFLALGLSWMMIIIYVWFRFGNIRWGLAAVAALIHDVIVAGGCIALTYYIADTAIGKALMLDKFRIDLGLVAALLTVIGYSVNDTIIVFDRIRENRGRLSEVTGEMVDVSINQTLSRTVLTWFTSILTVLTMYILGGPGIHGFAFVLLIGLTIGTYSSIGIASQILVRRAASRAG